MKPDKKKKGIPSNKQLSDGERDPRARLKKVQRSKQGGENNSVSSQISRLTLFLFFFNLFIIVMIIIMIMIICLEVYAEAKVGVC